MAMRHLEKGKDGHDNENGMQVLIKPPCLRNQVVPLAPCRWKKCRKGRGDLSPTFGPEEGVRRHFTMCLWAVGTFAWFLMLIPLKTLADQSADYSRTPVLMVHGWFVIDNAGIATWASMKKKLVADGWPEEYIMTPTFKDVRGCDPEHAEEIASWVQELRLRTGAEKIDIVAHSEGGLNSLYYIKYLCGFQYVRKLVALSGAFHGTLVACLDPISCGAKEMCIASGPEGWKENEVLKGLLSCDETPGDTLYTTIWSPWDEIIIPQEGSILQGAEVIQVQTPMTGHGGVLMSDETYSYVRDALLYGGANADGPHYECLSHCDISLADGTSPDVPDTLPSQAEDDTEPTLSSEEVPLFTKDQIATEAQPPKDQLATETLKSPDGPSNGQEPQSAQDLTPQTKGTRKLPDVGGGCSVQAQMWPFQQNAPFCLLFPLLLLLCKRPPKGLQRPQNNAQALLQRSRKDAVLHAL